MGNRALSPGSPCFDEEVYSTLSWADRKSACHKLFDECNMRNDSYDEIYDESRQEKAPKSMAATTTSRSALNSSPEEERLPALTDNMSSSEQSSEGDEEHSRMRRGLRARHIGPKRDEPTQNQNISATMALDQAIQAAASTADGIDELLRTGSSMDGTSSTSGSLGRDARADLGTCRGGSSVGGRDDCEDEGGW